MMEIRLRQLHLKGLWSRLTDGCPHLCETGLCELSLKPCHYSEGSYCELLRHQIVPEWEEFIKSKEVTGANSRRS